jgi:hypothetical protein
MRTTADELCPRCRSIPWGNGLTLGEMINVLHNDNRIKKMSDDEFNAAIFSTLNSYRDKWYCTTCWEKILDRLPSWMKGRR